MIGRYRQHERLFPKTDTTDRHVAAAAVAARKQSGMDIAMIITWNLKHFDDKEPAKAGVVAENPDVFLCRLLADAPESAVAAFIRMRDNLQNPPKSTRECADTLAAQGLNKFARLIAARLR